MKYINSAQRMNKSISEITYVLIDFSPSMDEKDYQPTRRAGAIAANRRLIETKAGLYPRDLLGIIAFDENAHMLQWHTPVGEGCQNLCDSLDKTIDEAGGTNFTDALKLAEECLFPENYGYRLQNPLLKFLKDFFFETKPESHPKTITITGNITKRIIMLTDGGHNGGGSPVKVAERLKKRGVTIECIGIAGNPSDVDEAMLRKIASIDRHGNPMYCFIGDTDGLISKYETMARHIRNI